MRIFRFRSGDQIRTGEGDPGGKDLVAPVKPGKIVAVGRNYADHARELGNEPPNEPILFLKPPSTLLDPGGRIQLPAASQQVEYEGE
jgi:2-keto-4-pentenoate hydratase/2-oxohepta-3-ene-1,7-dioic acid hydratase in catechol pathway